MKLNVHIFSIEEVSMYTFTNYYTSQSSLLVKTKVNSPYICLEFTHVSIVLLIRSIEIFSFIIIIIIIFMYDCFVLLYWKRSNAWFTLILIHFLTLPIICTNSKNNESNYNLWYDFSILSAAKSIFNFEKNSINCTYTTIKAVL